MIVLGIDPGSHTTGYGLLREDGRRLIHLDNGGIALPGSAPFGERLQHIHREMTNLIARFSPDVVALEDIFVARNVRSAMLLGHARGVIWLAAAMANVPVMEYTPAAIKQALVGNGQATKVQIQHMTRHILRLPEIAHEDAADALAVAICHCQTSGFTRAVERTTGRAASGRAPGVTP